MKFEQQLEALKTADWRVEVRSEPGRLPVDVLDRYPWIPAELRQLVEGCSLISSPDDQAWFLTVTDFLGNSGSAYAWNEWERQSLDAAEDDAAWKARIIAFWNNHLPIVISLKSGYAYVAIEKETLVVVQGEEPEYEETTEIAPSLTELLQMIASKDGRLSRLL